MKFYLLLASFWMGSLALNCVTKINESKTDPALFLLLNNSYREGTPSILTSDCTGTKIFDFTSGIPTCWNTSWNISSDTSICPSTSTIPCIITPSISTSEYANAQFKATTASGNISFSRRVSSVTNVDYCQFFIDGSAPTVEGSGVSGSINSSHTYPVTEGTHIFRWTYKKTSTYSFGYDRCSIDTVEIP